MNIFIGVLAAAAMIGGWFSTREGDYRLGATLFGLAMSLYMTAIVNERRNSGNRLLDAIGLVMATFGLASTVFFIRFEAARVTGQ